MDILLVELCDLSENHQSLKSPFIINSQKSLKQVQKERSYFSQAAHNWERYGCPKQSFISTISVWKIYTKAVVPEPFCNRVYRSMFYNFTEAREYSRNSVSMGRIDQSHAQKSSGVTTSTYSAISRPGAGLEDHWLSMLRASVWRCFGYPQIGKKAMSET